MCCSVLPQDAEIFRPIMALCCVVYCTGGKPPANILRFFKALWLPGVEMAMW